jgi:hypothetical protein
VSEVEDIGFVDRLASTPRAVPGRLVPALAGSLLVALALPVFVVAGWPLDGWLLAAVLWVGGQLFAALLARLPLGTGNLAAAGMRGIGTSFRAIAVGIPLVAVTVANESVGVAAALVYVLAFTLELAVGLLVYFGVDDGRGPVEGASA